VLGGRAVILLVNSDAKLTFRQASGESLENSLAKSEWADPTGSAHTEK